MRIDLDWKWGGASTQKSRILYDTTFETNGGACLSWIRAVGWALVGGMTRVG